ncbi:hypothetical protein [uncultured Weissella sp.]|uniref:hypothetical protein n=1 Tax=uncultured Weissella sp. TaxID=253243 RepID=UPI001417F750|nr:hypothetical protein [uncultured Weissella sp.]NEZ89567.1 hypothetical protein [Weissella paramesenteroides]
MLFSKKYRRWLPLHLLLVITGVQVGELIKSDNFVLEETLRTYIAFAIVVYLEVRVYYQIKLDLISKSEGTELSMKINAG